ncbi:unnamed protein product [Owenia fusiformis]|uniref:Uncharacterized protein n=1 Tax=Owenia fusiformis TaxID=6347 RepID=A0A8J1THZ9_OWEFU|nr:unnamed protein product [Owenia fusiformis]
MNEPQRNGNTGQPSQGLYTVDTTGLGYPSRDTGLVAGTWVNHQTTTMDHPPQGVIITQGNNINQQHPIMSSLHHMAPVIMEQQLSHQSQSQVIHTVGHVTLNPSVSQPQNVQFIQNPQSLTVQSHDSQTREQSRKDGNSRPPVTDINPIQNTAVSRVSPVLQDISQHAPQQWQAMQTTTPAIQYNSNQDAQNIVQSIGTVNPVMVPAGDVETSASNSTGAGGRMNLLYYCNTCNLAFTDITDFQTHSHSFIEAIDQQTALSQPILSQPILSQPILSQPTLPQPNLSQSNLSQPEITQSTMSQSALSQLALPQTIPTQLQVQHNTSSFKLSEASGKHIIVETVQPSDVNIQESWQPQTQPVAIKPKSIKDFSCKKCGEIFPNKTMLGVHMKTHRSSQTFPCAICNKQFTYRHTLKEHQKIHLDSREFSCSFCNKTFRRKEHRDRHITTHTGAKNYACQFCDAKFSRKYDLKLHQRGVHDQKGVAINSLRTESTGPTQNKVLTSGNDKHEVSPLKVIQNEQLVTVPIQQEPEFRSNYNTHLYDRAGTVAAGNLYNNPKAIPSSNLEVPSAPEQVKQLFLPEPPKTDQCVCGQCSKVFSSEEFLKIHLEDCLTTRRYYCKKCNRGFTRNTYLKAHMQICRSSSTVAFFCPHCPKGFKWKQNLTEHIKVHGNTSDLGCEKCNKKFSSYRSYKRHVKKHQEEATKQEKKTINNATFGISEKDTNSKPAVKKPHVCSVCGTSFRFINNLKDHSHIHTGARPHKCQYCPKTFIRKDHRIRHELGIHKGVKPYCCTLCGIAYTRKSTLLVHIERDHKNPEKAHVKKNKGEKIEIAMKNQENDSTEYRCYLCNEMFLDIKLLQDHFKTHTSKTFTCPTCDEVFVKERALELHINAHIKRNEIQFYQCQICGKCFITKAEYMKHGHVSELIRQFSCTICCKMFRKKSSVRKHVLMKHGASKVSGNDSKEGRVDGKFLNVKDSENDAIAEANLAPNEKDTNTQSGGTYQIEVDTGVKSNEDEDLTKQMDTGAQLEKDNDLMETDEQSNDVDLNEVNTGVKSEKDEDQMKQVDTCVQVKKDSDQMETGVHLKKGNDQMEIDTDVDQIEVDIVVKSEKEKDQMKQVDIGVQLKKDNDQMENDLLSNDVDQIEVDTGVKSEKDADQINQVDTGVQVTKDNGQMETDVQSKNDTDQIEVYVTENNMNQVGIGKQLKKVMDQIEIENVVQSNSDKDQLKIDIDVRNKGVSQHKEDEDTVVKLNENEACDPKYLNMSKTSDKPDSGSELKVSDLNNTVCNITTNDDINTKYDIMTDKDKEDNIANKDITEKKDVIPNEDITTNSEDITAINVDIIRSDDTVSDRIEHTAVDKANSSVPITESNIEEIELKGYGGDFESIVPKVKKNIGLLKYSKTIKMTSFTCGICEVVLKTRWSMLVHLKKHVTKNNTCKYCKATFKDQGEITAHVQQFHSSKDGESFRCLECGILCSTLKGLATHNRKKHDNVEKMFKCTFKCPKSFATKELLDRHIKRQHEIKADDKRCSVCDRAFSSQSKLEDHQRGHTGVKLLCYICGKKFKFKNNLGTHMKEQHNKKAETYLCTQCNKEFKSLRYLKTHLLTNVHWESGETLTGVN